ncbi:MAG: antibiotic biosynthesis monooxygenase [Hyphomicrobiales bacterium]
MIAVIFEVWPAEGRKQEYLDLAGELRPLLEKMDGFLSVERFESLYEPGKMLSLSVWENEEAVAAWRKVAEHRAAQAKGRRELFADYRLRVAGVIRDYGPRRREEAPGDSLATVI